MESSQTKYTVLIVDDIPDNIRVISSILYQKGVNLAIAQNGKEALAIALKKPPDLILLDVMMPGMDGLEVCRHLKADVNTKEVPVIFLTGRVAPEDIVKGFQSGAVDYITKPFNPNELLSRVFTHLELKRARDVISAQNQQLAKQNQELQALNATKDKFVSILAHDLKNPFNALLSLALLLKDELRNYSWEEVERYITRIYQAAEQNYTLLENLLEWARSQTGRLQFYPQKIHTKSLVDETIMVLQQHARNKEITLISEVSEGIVFVADVKMLSTVLRNLLSNAVKFTEQGGHVSVNAIDLNDRIEIVVQDTGVGIHENKLDTLFHLDVHHSTEGTAQERGTELGLILCKEFVEHHGGEILIESEVGKGSCFHVILPKEAAKRVKSEKC